MVKYYQRWIKNLRKEKERWRRECRWGGIKHLSDASLMAGHSGFRAPWPPLPPWGAGDSKKATQTHLSLCPSAHPLTCPHIPTHLIPPSSPSYAHFAICIIQHVMLLRHFVFLFLPILPFFGGACPLFTFRFDGVEGKRRCFVTSPSPNKCLQKKEAERRMKLREEWINRGVWRECRASAEWRQNGDWDTSCSSCGDATLHRERGRERGREGERERGREGERKRKGGSVCERERGIKQAQSMNSKIRTSHLFHSLFSLKSHHMN